MRWILAIAAAFSTVWAQSAPNSADTIRAGMKASVDQQRAYVIKQVAAVSGKTPAPAASFFTVPWVDPIGTGFNTPPCDPVETKLLEDLIEKNSKDQGVKADLIRAVINQESGARPCAVSSKGAQGLMQLMPDTAAEMGVHDPFDPKQNVEGGTKLLKQLLGKYNGNVALALAAYNAGSGRVDQNGGIPAIPETIGYVTSILSKLPKAFR
jgi:soluble lytic murein transglycosylase-like protein